MTLADQIRACYAEIGRADSMRALLAVVDKCEEMRDWAFVYPDRIAAEIEKVIARELGIQP